MANAVHVSETVFGHLKIFNYKVLVHRWVSQTKISFVDCSSSSSSQGWSCWPVKSLTDASCACDTSDNITHSVLEMFPSLLHIFMPGFLSIYLWRSVSDDTRRKGDTIDAVVTGRPWELQRKTNKKGTTFLKQNPVFHTVNLDLTNLYLTKSSLYRTIFFSPAKVTVKCMEHNPDIKNLDITKSSIWRT